MNEIMPSITVVGSICAIAMGAIGGSVANAGAGEVVDERGAAIVFMPPVAPAAILSDSDIELPDSDSDLSGEISDLDC